jgi:histidine triad (HIT) family protein
LILGSFEPSHSGLPPPKEGIAGAAETGDSLAEMPLRSRGALMTIYDHQNVFAKILRGEIPCHRVYENQRTLAFLDIMPRSPGHTLVIPKAPARGILDIAADDFAEVARTAKRIAVAAVVAFDAEGVVIQQFSEAASGQVVFHLHMHVMPMKAGIDLLPPQTRAEDAAVLEDHAARMIAALRN